MQNNSSARTGSVRAKYQGRAFWGLVLLSIFPLQGFGQAVRTNAGFKVNTLAPNDDQSTSVAVPLGFTANFFGTPYTGAYVNNNGNITFNGPLVAYTPEGLVASTLPIIAPFWADVDTRGFGSSAVTYGQDNVNGHTAFGVDYVNVGYYAAATDKLNSFQLVLIDRSDTGIGNFDIEFNYDKIQWETGSAFDSGGVNGLGGISAAAGYSNGSGSAATSLEIAGSRVPGSFLDSNPNGLIRRTLNSTVPGRLVFFVRGGVVTCSYSISPLSQSFSAGGGNGAVTVATAGACSWTANSNSSFITVTAGASGSGNGNVSYTVGANTSGSSRSGTINIAGQTFTVNQSGGAGTAMSVSPATLTIQAGAQSGTQTRSIQVLSSSGSVNWTAAATLFQGSGWMSISPSSGTATPNQASNITVSFPSLPAGLYQGLITVRDAASGVSFTVQVNVSMRSGSGGVLQLSQSAFFFEAAQAGFAPAPQALRVFNGGSGNLQWSIPSADLANASWLTFSPQSGISAAGAASSSTLTVNPGAMAPGLYQALVRVTSSGAANDPQLISISLLVTVAGTAPIPLVSPHGMAFAAVQGGAAPLPQTLRISNGGGGGLNFNMSATTANGGPWLHIPRASDSTAQGAANEDITIDPTGLLAGFFHGKIAVSFAGGGSQEIEVLLVVAPFGTVLQREEPGAGAGCSPSAMDMVVSSIGNGLSLPVSFPRTLLAQVVDNCGGNVTDATVGATIGSLSIVLQPVGGGLYNATWTPDTAATVTAAFVATHSTLGTVQRSFTLSAAAAPGNAVLPTILPNGIVEGAGFTALRPLVPGSIISIFGTAFASGDNSAQAIPLPPSLGNVSVKFGNDAAPLYFAGPSQVNAQVPFTLQPGNSVSIVVSANGRFTAPQNYLIAPNQPGIFQAAGTAAVLDSHFAQISAANPARLGDTIQIFANGLGLVDQSVATGAQSPSFSTVQSPVTVTVGGVQVPVDYQGLAPGFVGLYQVNVRLISGVPAGDGIPVVIFQNGIASNPNLPVSIPIR